MLEEKVSNRFTIDFVMKMLEKVYKNEKIELICMYFRKSSTRSSAWKVSMIQFHFSLHCVFIKIYQKDRKAAQPRLCKKATMLWYRLLSKLFTPVQHLCMATLLKTTKKTLLRIFTSKIICILLVHISIFFSLEIKAFLSDFQPLWELGTFLD